MATKPTKQYTKKELKEAFELVKDMAIEGVEYEESSANWGGTGDWANPMRDVKRALRIIKSQLPV